MRATRLCVIVALAVLLCAPGVAQAAKSGASSALDTMNVALEQLGANVRAYVAETITAPGSDEVGVTVFAKNVGNKQLGAHWVPNDPRRREPAAGDRSITYAIDGTEGDANSGLTNADTEPAIDRAMATWDGVGCSQIPIAKVDDLGYDLGYVQYLVGFGGVPGWLADYTHAGWLPGAFFDLTLGPGASTSVLGVTFTFVWVDDVTGDPTDIDGNGKNDVALRETYYNDSFTWSTSGPAWNDPEFDVETIALHEAGHGLSQAHFGSMFVDASDKEPPYWVKHVHFAPRALMNAIYWDTQRTLLGSDVGGHCSIWAAWPIH